MNALDRPTPPSFPTVVAGLACLVTLAGCASAPAAGAGPCPRPDPGEVTAAGLPADFDVAGLAGRWNLTVVTATGVAEPRVGGAPLVLVPAADSLYAHPSCLDGGTCAVHYPLRGWVERPLDAPMTLRTDPTSDDPGAPGAVLEWSPGRGEAVLVFGNPPVQGRVALDAGASFYLTAADTTRFTGFWNDGGLKEVVALDGRRLGTPGGWFCAERAG